MAFQKWEIWLKVSCNHFWTSLNIPVLLIEKRVLEYILPVAVGKEYSVSVHAVSVHQNTLTLKWYRTLSSSDSACSINYITNRQPLMSLSQITVRFKCILKSASFSISQIYVGFIVRDRIMVYVSDGIWRQFEKVRNDNRFENWTSIWEFDKGHRFENWTPK